MFRDVKAQQNLRLVIFVVTLCALAAGGWAAFYAYDRGLTKSWRKSIIETLEQHGVYATIGKLTIDPVEGLVARNVFLYDDPKQKQLLAKINRISLDIDLGNLMRDEPFLSQIDFKNADLALPLDPGSKESEILRIRDFSAHLLMENGRVEITRAGGQLSGVAFSIQGSLLGYQRTDLTSHADRAAAKERMKSLNRRRTLVFTVAQALDRFKFRGPAPRVDIAVSGDMSDADTLHGTVAFNGTQITHREYVIQSVKGTLELQRGELALQHLILNDESGELHLSGVHKIGTPQVDFHLDSSASIHRLLKAMHDDLTVDGLQFTEAPTISVRGTYDWMSNGGSEDPAAAPTGSFELPVPLKMIGSAKCDDFSYQGASLGGSVDFNIDHERLYLRNVSIEDAHAGTLDGDLLITPEESHYDSRLRMDPTLLSRFIPDGGLKSWLKKLKFTDDSAVQVEMEGHRTSAGPQGSWVHKAEIDLRDFEANGQTVDRFECDVDVNSERIVFKDVRVERNKASAFEPEAIWSHAEKKLTLSSLTSALDPATTAAIFSPVLAEHLSHYPFETSPNLQIKGTVVPDDLSKCDLTVVLTSRGGSSSTIGGYDLGFTGASGNLQLEQGILTLNLNGKTAANTSLAGLTLTEATPIAFAGRFPVVESPIPPAYKVVGAATTGASFHLAGVDIPLPGFDVEIVSEGSELLVASNAAPFDGKLSVSVAIPNSDLPGYKSTVVAKDVDFGKLAHHLSPDLDTEGKLRVLCSFSGVNGEPASIDGSGEMELHDGNVFAIPLLGPLSPVISKLYQQRPVGYSVAREATATFKIRGGRILTDDFTSSTGAFTLSGNGEVDFLNDRLDLHATLKARRAVGVLLYPVSRLFRFSAKGTLKEPNWQWLERDSLDTTEKDENSSQN
ncbi:MAG: hypothetical protein R3F19_31795 [Verrucomicrobiales bacterium]